MKNDSCDGPGKKPPLPLRAYKKIKIFMFVLYINTDFIKWVNRLRYLIYRYFILVIGTVEYLIFHHTTIVKLEVRILYPRKRKILKSTFL